MTVEEGVPELILVRHASTAWSGRRYCGRSDPSLDGAGRVAARRLASILAPTLPVGIRVVSSPLLRARETAAVIAEAAGSTGPVIDDRWREVDFGVAEGRTFEALAAIEPALATRLATGETVIDWPDGERAETFADRVAEAWRDLVGAGLATVLVSHAGPLRIAMAIARDVPPTEVAILEPASFARLRLPAAGWTP